MTLPLYAPPRIVWGSTMCFRRRCVQPAAVALEGWPLCWLHLEDEIEELIAEEIHPWTVGHLPVPGDE